MSDEEVSQWNPEHPRLKQVADIIRDMALYKAKPGIARALMEPSAALLESLSYGDRTTTGRGETTHVKPEVLEGASDLSNLIPGKLVGGLMSSIGPVGLRRLGDLNLWKKYLEIRDTLAKTPHKDWKLQKEIVEDNPGWFAVPRGRDADPSYPHVKFGYEVPEAKLGESMGGSTDARAMLRHRGVMDLPDLLDSPRHYKAYPELERYSASYDATGGLSSGRFNAQNLDIGLGPQASDSELLKTLNHELEHFVQRKEGWPSGTNTESAGRRLESINLLTDLVGEQGLPRELLKQSDLAKLMKDKNPKHWAWMEYSRAAGEQMAEAAAKSAAKGGGHIPRSYTASPSLMYDPQVQAHAIQALTKKLDEAQYSKDLADEIGRYLK